MVIKVLSKVLLVLLLLPIVASASSISPRMDSLKQSVLMRWRASGATTDQLSSARVQTAINEAIQTVCDDFPAIVKLDTITLATGTMGASLNSDFNRLANVFRIYGDTLYPLLIVEENYVDSFVKKLILSDYGHVTGIKESPSICYAAGDLFMTIPRHITDGVVGDSFLVTYYANDAGLSVAADETQVLPRYRLAIIYHAVASLYAELGQIDKSLAFMQFYSAMLTRRSDVKGVPQ